MAVNGVTGGGLAGNGLLIADLPPEVQRLIQQRQGEFQDGALDKIDTADEAAKLLNMLGQEGRNLPNTPQMQGLNGDLMAMIVEWLQSQRNSQAGAGGAGGQGGQGGRNLGGMSGTGTGSRSGRAPVGDVQDSGTRTGSADLKGNTNAEKAFNYFVGKGLSPQQAAGIVGNLHAESGVNPGIQEQNPIGNGRGGYGIAQWTGPRRNQLENFARQRGTDPSDMATQLDFLWSELNSSEKGALDSLRGANSASDAARIFSEKFERPGIVRMDARVNAANSALANFGNGPNVA